MLLSVSELNEYVRKSLAIDPFLQNISIKGEISNFRKYSSGHFYFTLKDEQSAVSCVMFHEYNQTLSILPEDGMAVELRGSASLYSKTGQYQFYATRLQIAGVGELYLLFEKSKEKLRKLGLFDSSIKKTLPYLPKMVGVISSSSGAVIHDILQVAKERNANVSFCLYPSKVQGQGASLTVIKGIEYFNQAKNVECIIIARGGGSFEDLFEFNNEDLAFAIRASKIPVISAIGHETDFTIADFVADLRAATPSQAAERLIKDRKKLLDTVLSLKKELNHSIAQHCFILGKRIEILRSHLLKQSPIEKIKANQQRVLNDKEKLKLYSKNSLQKLEHNLQNLNTVLGLLRPENILKKGYAIVEKKNIVVDSITKLNQNDGITIQLMDGKAKARIE